MPLNVRLDLVGVEWVKIWQLLERVSTVSVGIKFGAHEMVRWVAVIWIIYS